MIRGRGIALWLLFSASAAWSQQLPEIFVQETEALGEGWHGFSDLAFIVNAFLTLMLASILGAVIAYHPKHRQTADTLEEIEAPKVFITYAVIGALIGIMVVKYGLIVGFVLFGIGGLIRFRTVLRSAKLTGHVIFVTLIGLSSGLELPHVAVLATAFGFVLIYVLEARITYRIDVRGLEAERVVAAAAAYRRLIEQHGGRIMNEKKNPERCRVTFIFRGSRGMTRERLENSFEKEIDQSLRGSLDWGID